MMHQDAFVFNFCFDLSVVKVRFQKIQTNVQVKSYVSHSIIIISLNVIVSSRNLDWEERVSRKKTVPMRRKFRALLKDMYDVSQENLSFRPLSLFGAKHSLPSVHLRGDASHFLCFCNLHIRTSYYLPLLLIYAFNALNASLTFSV